MVYMSESIDGNEDGFDENVLTEMLGPIQTPEGGYGWVIVIAYSFVSFFFSGFASTIGMIIEKLVENDESAKSLAPLIPPLLFLMTSLIALPSAISLKYTTPKILLITSGLILSISLTSTYFVRRFELYFLTLSILPGIGFGVSFFSSNAQLSVYFIEKRAIAIAVISVARGIGAFVIPIILNQLFKSFSLNASISIYGSLTFIIPLLGFSFRPPILLHKDGSVVEEYSSKMAKEYCQRQQSEEPRGQEIVRSKKIVSKNKTKIHFHLKEPLQGDVHKNMNVDEMWTNLFVKLREKSKSDQPVEKVMAKWLKCTILNPVNRKDMFLENIKKGSVDVKKCPSFLKTPKIQKSYKKQKIVHKPSTPETVDKPDKDNIFLLSSTSFLSDLVTNIPLVYIVMYSNSDKASYLPSLIGVGGMVGQLFSAFLLTKLNLKPYPLKFMSMVVSSTMFLNFSFIQSSFVGLVVVCVVFGISLGVNRNTFQLILLDYTGINDFTLIYSIIILITGISSFGGLYATGIIISRRLLKIWEIFFISCWIYVASTILFSLIFIIKKCSPRNNL